MSPIIGFVVRRGRCRTFFRSYVAAYRFWRAYLGSVLEERRAS